MNGHKKNIQQAVIVQLEEGSTISMGTKVQQLIVTQTMRVLRDFISKTSGFRVAFYV